MEKKSEKEEAMGNIQKSRQAGEQIREGKNDSQQKQEVKELQKKLKKQEGKAQEPQKKALQNARNEIKDTLEKD